MNRWRVVFANLILITLGAVVIVHILPLTGAFSIKSLLGRLNGPCKNPLEYHIGPVDPRFNITSSSFLSDTYQAVAIWNKAYGDTLFVYNPQGDLAVNLIYDVRQTLDTQINTLENTVQGGKGTLDQQISQYENLVADFKAKLNDFNSQVALWNSRGGAPPQIYDQLIREQKNLMQEADTLNSMARQLNQSTNDYNSQVETLNQTINQFNAALSVRPEEGSFDPKTDSINIYFTSNQAELIHTLAHEFGHALGLQHNSNSQSIMYANTVNTLTPTQDDLNALKSLCNK